MASPDLPPPPTTHKDDEQFPGRGNGINVKSTPPDSGKDSAAATNKRKRDLPDTGNNDNEDDKSTKVTPAVDTADTVETAGVKEVEMKDAETIDQDNSSDQGIKEVEMQDADVVSNRTTNVEENSRADGVADVHEESKMHQGSSLNVTEGCKQDEGIKEANKPTKVDESESNKKQSVAGDGVDGSGPQALGEVATLLKQVQESDSKAKLEVEVKVKKMDHGVVKENGENEKTQGADQVRCE